MNYFMLVAGKGTRLHPITLSHPKSLYMLDDRTTVIERMLKLINKHDPEARIFVVTGFMHEAIAQKLQDIEHVTLVYNPFYAVTNSLGSLWFARDELQGDCVLINGDIVMEEALIRDVVCRRHAQPSVLLDSSIKKDGDYNVQVNGDQVVVMSKGLSEYSGEYAGVAILPAELMPWYKREMLQMIENGQYDQWYEDVLVNMIFKDNLKLLYDDIADHEWTEIDCVSDLVIAKAIQESEPNC